MALFRAKFACILATSNPVFRWESCKGNVWESVKNCLSVCKEAGTHGWISLVARGCKPPEWCTRAKHARMISYSAQLGYTFFNTLTIWSFSFYSSFLLFLLFWKNNFDLLIDFSRINQLCTLTNYETKLV